MEARAAWKTFLALLFGAFVTMEASIFQGPALPSVARHFDIPINLSALILLSYYLALTVCAPMIGRFAGQVGRKRIVLTGLCVFGASEFAAALAPSFTVFLAARFVQGLGVACIVPIVLAYINILFHPDKRGTALGIFTFAGTFGAATGGLIGGLLIDSFGWPSIYWVSGSFSVLGFIVVAVAVPETHSAEQRGRFDLPGAVCLFVTIAALLSIPTWAGAFGIASIQTLAAVAVSAVALTALWRLEARAGTPVVDLGILKSRAFALPMAIYWLHILFYSGVIYSLAFFINDRPGGSASQFGFINMFLTGSSMLAAPIAGRLVDRIDPRNISVFTLAVSVVVLLLFGTIRLDTPLWAIALIVIPIGLMAGANTPAVMKQALCAVPAEKTGAGTGLFSMLKDLGSPTGSGFALAIFGATVAGQTQATLARRAQEMGLDPALVDGLAASSVGGNPTIESGTVDRFRELNIDAAELLRQATVDAMPAALSNVGYVLAGVATLALLLAVLLPRSPSSNPAAAPTLAAAETAAE